MTPDIPKQKHVHKWYGQFADCPVEPGGRVFLYSASYLLLKIVLARMYFLAKQAPEFLVIEVGS
jgi:hypothetical protein